MLRRVLIPGLFALSLAACGGGGGSSSSVPNLGDPLPAGVESVPVQRTLTNQSLQGAESLTTAIGQGSSTVPLSIKRSVVEAAARRVVQGYRSGARATTALMRPADVTYGPCTSASESATINVSATETQMYQKDFYDANCTQIKDSIYLDIIAASTTSASATGNVTDYDTSGNVTAYDTVSVALTGVGTSPSTFTIEITQAPNATAPLTSDIGISCTIASGSATCGSGSVGHDATAAADTGATMTITATMGTAQNGLSNVGINGSASGYSGALNTLKLSAGTFPAWTISGGTLANSASLSGSIAFTSTGAPASGTMTVADSADHGSVSFTVSSTGGTGVITDTSTNATVATFSVDQSGNGSVKFSNGTTAPIVNWQIQG